ncbi:hypothetical protein [Methanobrevibacter sp.]|uniref:hypothetical protein n=1 Tax=Methanobrevibacter sp. TaxID=66852 RepID=UPI00386F132F
MSKNLVKNTESIDDKFIEEFVRIPSGLPILLVNILDEIDDKVELKRMEIYRSHPEFEELDKKEIEITSQLLKEGKFKQAEEFQLQYALDFLKEYPQFQCMVKGVESELDNDFRIMINSIKEAFFGEFDYF